MKYLILLCAIVGLTSCSQSNPQGRTAGSGDNGNGKTDTQKPVTARKNTTEYGVCGTGASSLTTPEGRWEMFESADKFYFKIALEFKEGKLTLRQDCYHQAHRLTSSVTTTAIYDRGIITVLADASDVKTAEDKDGKFECKTSLKQGASNYGFAGHCLELNNFQGRDYLKFVPQ